MISAGRRCGALHRDNRLPMAAASSGLPALFDRAELLLSLDRGQAVAGHQPCPGPGGPRESWPRARSNSRRDRQPVGQGHRERRSQRVRRGQEDQAAQAPHRHRHAWSSCRLGRAQGRHSGSRWCASGAGHHTPALSLVAAHLCRWRLRGRRAEGRLGQYGRWTVQIIKRSGTAKGFGTLPRRWVVERTFAWAGRCRRLAKDVDATIQSSEAWTLITHVRRLTRVLARA